MRLTDEQKQRAADSLATLIDGRNAHQDMCNILRKYGCDLTYGVYYGMRTGKTAPTKCLIDALCRYRKVDRATVIRAGVYDALPRCRSYYCTHGA